MWGAVVGASATDVTNATNSTIQLYIGLLGVVAGALTLFGLIYRGRHAEDRSARVPVVTSERTAWQIGDLDRRVTDIGRRDDEQDRRMGAIEEIARSLDAKVERNRIRIEDHLEGVDGRHGGTHGRRRGDPPHA